LFTLILQNQDFKKSVILAQACLGCNKSGNYTATMSVAKLPVLYSFRRCPYAIRARLALQASGVVYELREVVLKNKPAHMLALSPKGTVPVLWVPSQEPAQEGRVIEQSLDIMLWALRQRDPNQWLPSSLADLQKSLEKIAVNDGLFKTHLDRYKYPNRFGLVNGLQDRDLASVLLLELDAELQQQNFLSGPHWGLTDAALAPFVRQFAHVDRPWFNTQNWAVLKQWLTNFETAADFTKTMEKRSNTSTTDDF
jgi:glutathione S-transferase